METNLSGATAMAPTLTNSAKYSFTPPLTLSLFEDEHEFFHVVLNCDAAAKCVPTIRRDALCQLAALLIDGCVSVINQDKRLTPDALITELNQLSDDAPTQTVHENLRDAARYVERNLSDVSTDKRLYQASEAERLARVLNGDNEAKPVKRFNLLTIPELFQRPDPEFLVERLLVTGSTVLFSAKEESFKSFLATDLAACIATGKPWHGLKVKRGPVVYVAAEGASGLKKRLQAWMHHHQETISATEFFVLDEPLQIATAAERAAFISQINELKPVLIVLDTVRRCTTGLDENSAADMGLFMDALGEMAKQTGAACMGIHHHNKSGDYSGSTTLAGSVDTRLTCKRDRDDVVTIKTEKQKDFEKHPPISFEPQIVPVPGSKGEATSLVFKRIDTRRDAGEGLTETEQKVLYALADQGKTGATNAAWLRAANDAGISKSVFMRALPVLLAANSVEPIKGQPKQRGVVYAVVSEAVKSEQESA